MILLLFWVLIALFSIVPGFFGMYLLFSPIDHLTVRYQNMRLSMSQMPLKDEDFPRMGRVVFFIKLIGALMMVASVGVISIALQVN